MGPLAPVCDRSGDREEKLIGTYAASENAEKGIDLVRDQPGFRERPEGFAITQGTLDETDMINGFVTIGNGGERHEPIRGAMDADHRRRRRTVARSNVSVGQVSGHALRNGTTRMSIASEWKRKESFDRAIPVPARICAVACWDRCRKGAAGTLRHETRTAVTGESLRMAPTASFA